jgi:hypothetical protein
MMAPIAFGITGRSTARLLRPPATLTAATYSLVRSLTLGSSIA